MRTLDLGCGTAKVKNAIGVDKYPLKGVDILAKLDKYPYPLADNSFDEIYLNDVIEHLPDTIATMEEIYRICKPDGRVFIRTINWNSHYNAMDPTHVRTFSEHTFDFFGKIPGRSYYSTAKFDVVKVGYVYNARAKKLFQSEKLMKFLSHYLNNVLEDLHFELKAIKEETIHQESKEKKSDNILDIIRCPRCLDKLKKTQCEKLSCVNKHYRAKYNFKNPLPVLIVKNK